MRDDAHEKYCKWGLEAALTKHVGLRVKPSPADDLCIGGIVHFRAVGPDGVELSDAFDVAIAIPVAFPKELPSVRETGGKIPQRFHHLDNGELCLGSPTAISLTLAKRPTILALIDELLIPYLFGFQYYSLHKKMPYGELSHGPIGLLEHFASLYKVSDLTTALYFLRLTALRRRFANKWQCPCRSGRRLGRCHNKMVNEIRSLLGHKWYQQQVRLIESGLHQLNSDQRRRLETPTSSLAIRK